MEQITINLLATGITPVCHVSQFDDGRTIRINLKKGAEVFTLSGTEEVKMRIRKPDNTERVVNITNTSSSYVDYVSTPEDCDIEGVNVCELVVGEAGSKNFLMNVEEDAYGGGADIETLTASGPIATFETNIVDNLVDLKAEITPIQDLHGYDYPWPAGGGKNKIKTFDFSTTTAGVSYTSEDTGEIKMSASTATTNNSWMFNQNTGPEHTFLVKAGQYFLSGNTAGSSNKVFTYLLYRDWGSSESFTSTNYDRGSGILISFDTDKEVYLQVNAQPGFVGEFTLKPQLEEGSSATAWTPYSNICPITGHTEAKIVHAGKNLLDTRQESIPQYAGGSGVYANVTYTPNNDGSITINGTSTGASVLFFDPVTLNPLTSYPFPTWKYTNNRYTLSVTDGWGLVTGDAYIQATVKKIKDNSIVSRQRLTASVFTRSFTVREDEYIADAFIRLSSGASAPNINIKIQLELGSTATDYEPYTGTEVTVQFGQTVYGGTIDLTSGVLRIDVGRIVFDGTQAVGLANWRPLDNSVGWLYKPEITPNIKNYVVDESNLPYCKLKSNRLKTVVYGGAQGLYGNDIPCISLVGTIYWGIGMRVKDTSLNNATAINNWLSQNPIEVIYELETPVEIQLTPQQIETLLGTNNVYADIGDVELKYLKQV